MEDVMEGTEPDYLCTPEQALHDVAHAETPVLVDFDETLCLRNSTEEFIDQAMFGLLAAVLLRVLEITKPWRWTGGEPTRDVWRIRVILYTMPWQWSRWRRFVQRRGPEMLNQPLSDALRQSRGRVVVASIGFEPIIRPLLEAMGWGDAELIACSLSGFDDRASGKLALVQSRLGAEVVAQSLVVTDSRSDAPLLAAAAQGQLVDWPDALYMPALRRVYLPFDYTTKVKRPGAKYLRRSILLDDFMYWLLATIALTNAPVLHVIGLGCLLVSFWAIYETGYVDNDRCGELYESTPKLSRQYATHMVATPRWQPWLWSLSLGVAGIALLRPNGELVRITAVWVLALLALHALFRIYNRVDYSTRVWLLYVLQLARASACLLVVPANLPGAMALIVQAICRWIPYYIHRNFGLKWAQPRMLVGRVVLYAGAVALLFIVDPFGPVWGWTTLAVLAFGIFKARHEFAEVVREASFLNDPKAGTTKG